MASNDPKISIIVPVYNVERYIDDCLLSLRVQTHRNFTTIVVNDGSSDGSMDRVRAHARIDDRIEIVSQENLGLGGARNTGIEHSSGEFVVFVDSDDFVSANFLQVLLAAQRESGSDIVSCRHSRISEAARFLSNERPVAPPLSDYQQKLGLFGFSVAWARLFKRDILLKTGIKFPEHLPHEDLFFTYKIFRDCSHTLVEDSLYFWRYRDGSLSASISPAHLTVPWRLRRDTQAFLDSGSATEQEYALAARRNLLILKFFFRKALREDSLRDGFNRMVVENTSEIQDDFRRLISSTLEDSCMPDLRELIQWLTEAGVAESDLCVDAPAPRRLLLGFGPR